MSHKHRKNGRRAGGPPEGAVWIWHTLELIASPAWRTRSIHCRRLIDFLEIEHLRHGGADNGSLLATYNQLEEFGIGRRFIFAAIREAEQRGLIVVERGGRKGVVLNELNRFRLTYAWSKTRVNGLWDWHVHTDNWRQYEDASIDAPSCNDTGHKRELPTVHHRSPAPLQVPEKIMQSKVSKGALPSISGVGDPLPATVNQHAATLGPGAPHQKGGDRHPMKKASETEALKPLRDILDLTKLIPLQD